MKFITKHWIILALLVVAGTIVSLQREVMDLKQDLAASKVQIDRIAAETVDYDQRVSIPVAELTKRTFGEEAIRANPLSVAFRQPGRHVEGEIYRFISLSNRFVNRLNGAPTQ
jgi:hypothetical protein